ncbi:hypothetical protein RND81_09G104100 [Saponaria officinalis]|uniref:Uncharacterized protein n=1 Tax=Saponaria officinalis TaxID=3572 RepID=A0AAW1IJ33_SAPOF
MRDMVSCLSEHAVKVSETTCSSSVSDANIVKDQIPAVRNAVVAMYRTRPMSSQKPLLITVTWCRNQLGQGGLIIDFGDSNSFKLNTFSRLFRKKKGHKSILSDSESDTSKIDIFWDLSGANYYHSGPEPVDGYYILVSVDADLALALGDLAQEAANKRRLMGIWPRTVLISRREHYSGNTLYCTKAQFCESAVIHDIVISCSTEHHHHHHHHQRQRQERQPVLYVSIDKKTVIKVGRLQWNFRGNQTVFVDGLLIDVMWDVHDWFYNQNPGYAVFMFKIRSGGESRLWLEDKFVHNNPHDSLDFSLLLYATKNP